VRKWPIVVGLFMLIAALWAGCQQNAVTVPVRSLERSGRAAFLCLRQPNLVPPGLELRACSAVSQTLDAADYVTAPHVIALVTQQARGEVAVLDVTAGGVIDVDPTLPGANFLPVGALPTDIVTTPGSNAAFVASGDPLRPGIFALSASNLFLPYQLKSPPVEPSLAGFPACSLPAVASQLLIVADRAGIGASGTGPRARCPGFDAAAGAASPGYDLSSEAALFGTAKILALMPDLGELAVIDAQALLMRTPGSFDACPIERMLALRSDLGSSAGVADAGVDATADGGGTSLDGGVEAGASCSSPAPVAVPPPSLASHPAAMALADDGRVFVSDDRVPVVHVVDLSDPCSLAEREPLLPQSIVDPSRAVTTGAIAVTPLLTDQRRFVYAVDVKNNGSVMVFDVSADSTTRTPLLRPDVQANPREPPDRIAYSSPVTSLTFARHEVVPDTMISSSVFMRGVPCDPKAGPPNGPLDPNHPDFQGNGAGPHLLRGIFGFLALSDGRIAVVDEDDFDGPCRRPQLTDDLTLGCSGQLATSLSTPINFQSSSKEVSCNVVERHRPRSNQYFTNNDLAGQHAPAMQGFPLLHDSDGTALSIDPMQRESVRRPKMLTPRLTADLSAWPLLVSVTGLSGTAIDSTWWDPARAQQNSVAFDLREPRAHLSEAWSVTYEGAFGLGAAGRLQCEDPNKSAIECERGDAPSRFDFYDSSVGFCTAGVQGQDLAQVSLGIAQGDIIEVTSELPDPADPYWTGVEGSCSRQTCEQYFGTQANPITGEDLASGGRDFLVHQSFQDHLVLEPNPKRDSKAPFACCFPYPVSYKMRAGKHWIVIGSGSGFAHHVIPDPSVPDPSIGACVFSCDPTLSLRNGRAVGMAHPADPTQALSYDDPRAFHNSRLRFVLYDPEMSDCSGTGAADAGSTTGPTPCLRRDMFFSFQEVGGFEPLLISLSATSLVMPESISFVPGLEQLAIPDPVSQGLMLFDLSRLAVVQTLF
jgi:hypothetical protein